MALQGTLDTFALPDVLRLLGSTNKSGCLRVDAGADSGRVHVADGEVVAASSTRVPESGQVVDVVFDLLRLDTGSFAFDPDADAPEAGPARAVEALLGEAEAMLAEWRQIEKVVPSLDCWVKLSHDLPGDEVVVSSARWRTIVAIGGGTTVRQLGDALDLAEVPVSRTVKDLVEADLAEIDEAHTPEPAPKVAPAPGELSIADLEPVVPAEPAEPAVFDVVAEPEPPSDVADATAEPVEPPEAETEVVDDTPAISADDAFLADVFPGLAGRTADDVHAPPVGADSSFDLDPPLDAGADIVVDPPAPVVDPPAVPEPQGAETVDDENDLARQLANLSPRAAAAVQAASEGPIVDAVDANGSADEDDETINRGLLLKFLGSVNN